MTSASPTTTSASSPPAPTSRESHYLPTLDGWRAIAILLVILHHAAPSLVTFFGPRSKPFGDFFFTYGITGIHVFFAISGFLIATRLLQDAPSRLAHLRPFFIRRAYRILPPMFTFLAFVGLLGATGLVTIKLKQWLSCLFLYANYRLGGTWSLSHFWTLSMEEHFYLTWPFLFAFAGARRALPLTLAIATLMGVWRALDLVYVLHPTTISPPTLRTDTAADGLLFGAAAALFLARPRVRDTLTRLARHPLAFPAILLAYLSTFAVQLPTPFGNPATWSLRAILLPFLLIATLLHPTSLVSHLLELRPLRYVGRLSYSLYLYQQIFLVWPGVGSPLIAPLQTFPANLLCAAACALASYYLIEKPFIRAGYRATIPRPNNI